jgi:Uncharacterized protein conserved in bacteria N-term (DUF3322)
VRFTRRSQSLESGLLLRQLPIEGIGTKWLAQYAVLVLALLGDPDFPVESAAQVTLRGVGRCDLGRAVTPDTPSDSRRRRWTDRRRRADPQRLDRSQNLCQAPGSD